jgi:hypothetical protein
LHLREAAIMAITVRPRAMVGLHRFQAGRHNIINVKIMAGAGRNSRRP